MRDFLSSSIVSAKVWAYFHDCTGGDDQVLEFRDVGRGNLIAYSLMYEQLHSNPRRVTDIAPISIERLRKALQTIDSFPSRMPSPADFHIRKKDIEEYLKMSSSLHHSNNDSGAVTRLFELYHGIPDLFLQADSSTMDDFLHSGDGEFYSKGQFITLVNEVNDTLYLSSPPFANASNHAVPLIAQYRGKQFRVANLELTRILPTYPLRRYRETLPWSNAMVLKEFAEYKRTLQAEKH